MSVFSHRFRSSPSPGTIRFDATGALTLYLVMLFFIPAQWVLPGLGAAGRPANVFAVGLLALWVVIKFIPSFERRSTFMRWPLLANVLALTISYGLGHDRGLPPVEALSADRAMLDLLALNGVLLVSSEGLSSGKDLHRLTKRITHMGAAIALVGLFQFVTGIDPFSAIEYPGLVQNSELSELGRARYGIARPSKGVDGSPDRVRSRYGLDLPDGCSSCVA